MSNASVPSVADLEGTIRVLEVLAESDLLEMVRRAIARAEPLEQTLLAAFTRYQEQEQRVQDRLRRTKEQAWTLRRHVQASDPHTAVHERDAENMHFQALRLGMDIATRSAETLESFEQIYGPPQAWIAQLATAYRRDVTKRMTEAHEYHRNRKLRNELISLVFLSIKESHISSI